MNKTIVGSLLVIAIVIGSVVTYYANLGKGFIPQTEKLTFTRDVRKDGGVKLDPSKVISMEGVRLTEVFSQERMNRIGADTNPPDGVGLSVDFIIFNGSQELKRETFLIPGWQKYEAKFEDRREFVKSEAVRFKEPADRFTDVVKLKLTFGIVVDTTEGVDSRLSARVKEVIRETGVVELASKGHSVVLNMYHITESSYQGGRRRVKLRPPDIAAAEQWLLNGNEESNSSVLRGLHSILQEMSTTGESLRLDIFTDGLENLKEFSMYQRPEVLEEGHWGKIDEVAHLEALKLEGVEIHLYPLPPRNSRHEMMMEKAHSYLADRLTKAGANVKLEPF